MTADEALQTVMPFGRFKGRTLEKIAEDSPLYIDWLTDEVHNPKLKEAVLIVARIYKTQIEDAADKAD